MKVERGPAKDAHGLLRTMLLIPLEFGIFFKHQLVGFVDVLSKQTHLTTSTHVGRAVCLCTRMLASALGFVSRLSWASI